MRQYDRARIIEAAKKPPSQRRVYDMLSCKKPTRDTWAQCSVCGRWLHFQCINLKIAPENDFACPICEAQYQ